MKPYGMPRVPELEYPDVADIQHFGLASHVGRIAGKSGDFHSYTRSAAAKASTRRYYKRIARAAGKKECLSTTD